MEQELIYNIAIIGCGASGGFASVLLLKNPNCKIVAFDVKDAFSTLLPTGGGRCNLTNNNLDVFDFVKNYPRGEKFLLSVFSKFGVEKTRELFKDLGIKTYVQKDNRVFPTSDSSKIVIQTLQKHLNADNFELKKEKVSSIKKEKEKFIINDKYEFDCVVIATGGRGNGFELAKSLGHNIIDVKPSLCSLDIKEKYLYKLAGLSFQNVEANVQVGKKKYCVNGDLLFAHKFVTGPVIFKVSALSAFEEITQNKPLNITLKLVQLSIDELEQEIKNNSKKTIKNVFGKFVPESFIVEILNANNIDMDKQVSQIKKLEKEVLYNSLTQLKLTAIARIKDSEIVSAGGVDLNEVDSKTMQSKLVNGLYFTGEVLNIDAYTGGYNLQNCWSTAWIVANNFN